MSSIARDRKTLSIDTFYGVDYSKPALQVLDYHAIDILNFIIKDGVDQKRAPWEQMAAVPSFSYVKKVDGSYIERSNSKVINGIWRFKAEDGEYHVVAHVGKCLFEVLGMSTPTFKTVYFQPLYQAVSINSVSRYYVANELLDQRSDGKVSGQRLWLLTGNKYLCIRFSDEVTDEWVSSKQTNCNCYIRAVEDFAYIPVTTIGIPETDSEVTEGNATLDSVNLLTPLRKNKMLSATIPDGSEIVRTTRFHEFPLDTNINIAPSGTEDDITITIDYKEADA